MRTALGLSKIPLANGAVCLGYWSLRGWVLTLSNFGRTWYRLRAASLQWGPLT